MKNLVTRIYMQILFLIRSSEKVKLKAELKYWKSRKAVEGSLSNTHYEYFFTTHFGLNRAFYKGKKILDIGCGPRGSLEWADMALERIGLDPLANSYLKLGIGTHKMTYVAGVAERIPFPDEYFDVVSSFNSLDHVDDLEQSVNEIIRVLAPGGLFLLLVEIHPDPTLTEPTTFSWDVVGKFIPRLKLIEEKHYEKSAGMYESIKADIPFDHSNNKPRYGVLSAKFYKEEQGR